MTTSTKAWRALAPIWVIVFLEFLAMGLPLPVLRSQVHDHLGFGAFVVGLAIGAQSLITLLTRPHAGVRADDRGPRAATMQGLVLSGVAGGLAVLSAAIPHPPTSLAVLLAGRGLLGLGESLVVSGALAWGISVLGRERSGLVMAWIGIAMYGALAAGAPLGIASASQIGFLGISVVAGLAPIVGLGVAMLRPPVQAIRGPRLPFRRVAALIWLPGLGLSLCALSFAAIVAFSSHALSLTAFGAAYILARVVFGQLPDRLGGARVAVVATGLAAAGQLGLVIATSGWMVLVAAAVTGFGFSLSFPSFGVEAVRRVPPQNRGVALGVYAACFDAAMAFGPPVLGVAVGGLGHSVVFALTASAALGSVVVALRLATRPRS